MEDFPEHIKSLVQKEKESEEHEKRLREIERNTCKVIFSLFKFNVLGFKGGIIVTLYQPLNDDLHFHPNVQIKLFCVHPVKMMMESKLEVHKDKTLREATEMAYKVG